MAQQNSSLAQVNFGPAGNGGGDILHLSPANANVNTSASKNLIGFLDNNGLWDGVSGETSALIGGTAAQQALAAAGTSVFTAVPLNLPGNSAYEQVPFTVKASGWITLNGGTYTATIQPFLFASTAQGFTASVAAAIVSTTAVNVTVAVAAAATLTAFPWQVEATIVGDSTSGKLATSMSQRVNNGAQQFLVPAAGVNAPTGVNFATATPPLQFLVGMGVTGATVSAANTNLGSFFLES